MKYTEVQMNLFDVPDDYVLVHCISGDMALGKGIAKAIDDKFNVKPTLRRIASWRMTPELPVGFCYVAGRIYNLVTKRRYYEKPTLETMQRALDDLYITASDRQQKKLAMPLIGCGLDRLHWSDVSALIRQTFEDTDIEILVCRL